MYKRLATDAVKIFNENAYLSICLDNAIKDLNLNINDKIFVGEIYNFKYLQYSKIAEIE